MTLRNLSAALLLFILPPAASALPTNFYPARSVMAEGTWVRVGVEETGVYEISYSALRDMGFENPASVGVFGRGGRKMAENFTDLSGNSLIDSDITPVKVYHADNKLFFYALGTDNIQFVENSLYECGGIFMNKGKNIYTNYGYYYLTDSAPVQNMETALPVANPQKRTDRGVGYVQHELDLQHNNQDAGQIFWGEDFLYGPQTQTWEISMPDLVGGSQGAMECAFYTTKNLNKNVTDPAQMYRLSYGIGTSADAGEAAGDFGMANQDNIADYVPQTPSTGSMTIPEGASSVYVEMTRGSGSNKNPLYMANLDYWVVTYQKYIPTLTDASGKKIAQDLIALPELKNPGESLSFEIKDPMTKVIFDVTDPAAPRLLPIQMTGRKGTVTVLREKAVPVLAIFDFMSAQKNIRGYDTSWNRITSQNLHGLAEEGVDMAIITLPWLHDAAEELADVHRKYYGETVAVVDADQVYAEFSGGVPDPMAYRSFAKMLYSSPGRQIRNLLLLGPLYGDVRGVELTRDPSRGLIAYQTNSLNLETAAMNANDYYGMLADYIDLNAIEKQTMHIGVGILPCYYADEVKRYTKKIENFITDDSFAYRLTSYVGIGGVGDNHLHETQAVNLASVYGNLISSSSINTVIAVDAYGYDQSRLKWFDAFNNGAMLASYIGHGAPCYLNQNRYFFTPANVPQFRNKTCPFMTFFGCTISNTDRGQRGLGESMILDTEYGLIGSLTATRSTWSGQNYSFAEQFYTSFFTTNPNSSTAAPVKNVQTLGEIYMKTKNVCYYTNKLAYQLMADPGLKFPAPLQRISVSSPLSATPGSSFVMKGSVLTTGSTKTDNSFNGELVVRVMEPTVELRSPDLVTGTGSPDLYVPYPDMQITMSVAKVVNGEFEVEVYLPETASSHAGRRMTLNFCAYDPSTYMGASVSKLCTVSAQTSGQGTDKDMTAPVIESLDYDNEQRMLTLVASDDVALDLSRAMIKSGFQIAIDGDYYPEASAAQPILDGGPDRYTRRISVSNLRQGRHSAYVSVYDAAGNRTDSEITFTISDSRTFALKMHEEGVTDQATFYVDGDAPDCAEIHICSPEGEEVAVLPFLGGRETVWDATDNAGRRVMPGRYRAWLRETGDHFTKGYADMIIVPVI